MANPGRAIARRLAIARSEGKQGGEEQGLVEFHVDPIDSARCERIGVPKDRRLRPKDQRAAPKF